MQLKIKAAQCIQTVSSLACLTATAWDVYADGVLRALGGKLQAFSVTGLNE